MSRLHELLGHAVAVHTTCTTQRVTLIVVSLEGIAVAKSLVQQYYGQCGQFEWTQISPYTSQQYNRCRGWEAEEDGFHSQYSRVTCPPQRSVQLVRGDGPLEYCDALVGRRGKCGQVTLYLHWTWAMVSSHVLLWNIHLLLYLWPCPGENVSILPP